MSGVIYGLIDSDTLELRYVGQTVQPLAERFRVHKRARVNPHLNHWLHARPISIIVLEHSPTDLNEAERRWIAAMRAQGARLLNLTAGGDGAPCGNQYALGKQHNVESRAKNSSAAMGNQNALGCTRTPETRAKLRAALLGYKHTPEARANMSAAHAGHKHSAETRAKIGVAQTGRSS